MFHRLDFVCVCVFADDAELQAQVFSLSDGQFKNASDGRFLNSTTRSHYGMSKLPVPSASQSLPSSSYHLRDPDQ